MILYRYLFTEVMKPFFFMTIVLLVLLIATEISDTLTKILTGQFSDNAIWVVIGYQVPILLKEILPASFFLACLTSLHRLSQDSERAVTQAIGISDGVILKRLLISAALPVMLLQLGLNHFITPLSQEKLEAFVAEQKSRPITDIIDANSFYSIRALNATFYAGNSSPQDESLSDVFTIQKNDDRFNIISAEKVKTESLDTTQEFQFKSGQQTQFQFGTLSDYDTQRFGSLTLRIQDDYQAKPWQRRNAIITSELVKSDKRGDQLDVINRFATALYIPLFCLWAVALTRFKPRQARVGAMAFGIVLYVMSSFIYRTLSGAVSKADISLAFAPWWFLVVLAIIAILMMRRSV